MIIMASFSVPKETSRTSAAFPSLSLDSSSNRGTILPPVAMAISSSSTPPTHRTEGSFFCIRRWFASSSNPHWQITKLAPDLRTRSTMSVKYSASAAWSFLKSSAVLMSSLCLVFGLGGSNGQVRMQILASLISFAIWGWLVSLSITIPLISLVSSSLPPGFPSILIRSKFTSLLSLSATANTASTAIWAIWSCRDETTLDPRAVMAAFKRASLFENTSCSTAISSTLFNAH
mmetsp:Transcript_46982/g.92751  ORF Transcript_46982/g.92751 Transcript_46982/m.92751 type:complete len:232 (-) Transcript_46982:687-1382(-)